MSLQTRAMVACGAFGLIFTGLSGRLVQLAIEDNSELTDRACKAYEGKQTIFARRGEIRDVKGEVLARNEPLKTVAVDASLLYAVDKPDKHGVVKVKYDERDRVAKVLADSLKLPFKEVRDRFEPDKDGEMNRYIVIKKKISEGEARDLERALVKSKQELMIARAGGDKGKLEALKDLMKATTLADAGIRGVNFEQDFVRIYPEGQLLAHVVGFYGYIPKYDAEGKELKEGRFGGVEGIENSLDNWLTGLDGQRFFQKDANGRELVAMRSGERAPKHGANVTLTIDLGIQQIVEEELDAACAKLKPKRACVLMMDPISGEIMAMANRPVYNPNFPKLAKPEQKLNFAVSGAYEPGSTFKTIAAAGAMNRNKNVTIESKIFCENGRMAYPGGVLKDHHAYGSLTVSEIIAKSSNIGAVKLALGIGQEGFYNLVRDFGFGSRTGTCLPNETRGILHPLNKWTGSSMYHVPMGHEVAASPLQVVTATCVIANGGQLMVPQIVREITDDEGNVVVSYPPQISRELLKPTVAAATNSALEKVTARGGTAIRARVPGFRVAGKTGTAQIFDRETKKYSTEDHICSFVGYMPAEAPRFCMIVIIDDSATVNGHSDTGGVIAAPVFSKIAERTAKHLGLQPDPVQYEEDMAFRKQLEKEGKL
jgi:cell division protein FtsI/penicillin-binding protein 2